MNDFGLSQVLAALALVCGIVSFQFRNRHSILLWLAGSAIANACHFHVLDRPGPAVLALVIGIRFVVSALSTDRRLMYLFCAIALVVFLWSYTNALSYLALFATLLATCAIFQKDERRIRRLFMIAGSTWMVHNVLAGSPVAVLMDVTFVTSNAIGYRRLCDRGRPAPAVDSRGMKHAVRTDPRTDVEVGSG